MLDPKLAEALRKLKDALNGAKLNDSQSKERLKELVVFIEEKLDARSGKEGRSQLRQALETKVVDFESSHPAISRILEEIIDILTKLGI